MGSDEVYTSLQSNLINGSENNEFVLYTAGHGGVAKYYSYDEHTRVPDIIIMNDAIKEQLTDEQEKPLKKQRKNQRFLKLKLLQKQLKKKSFSTRRTWSPIQ